MSEEWISRAVDELAIYADLPDAKKPGMGAIIEHCYRAAQTRPSACQPETIEISLCHEAANIITNACQIIDVTKIEWGSAWSEWDPELAEPAPAPQKEKP